MNRVLQGRRVDEDGRKRYFDPRFGKTAVRVLPGEYYVTEDESEMIVTVLGSCISACIRDPLLKIGGMNHFMLPSSDTGQWGQVSAEMRYGNYAMEMLINDLMRRGARRDRLEFKLFGGAHIGTSSSDVGDKNIRFVRTYMRDEGFVSTAADLGGEIPRRIHYFPETGTVKRLALKKLEGRVLRTQEEAYVKEIEVESTSGGGDIELFD